MKKIFTVLTTLFTSTLLFGQTIIGTCNYSLLYSSVPSTSTLYKTVTVSQYDVPVVYDYDTHSIYDTYSISDTVLPQNNIFVENFKLKTYPQLPVNARLDLSGYLLKRGSNKILVSIGVGLGTTALACPIMLCSNTNVGYIAGGVILGIGGLTSLITFISGVSDLKKSGIILNGGSVVFQFNNAKFKSPQQNVYDNNTNGIN